jgi:hypothetical protein
MSTADASTSATTSVSEARNVSRAQPTPDMLARAAHGLPFTLEIIPPDNCESFRREQPHIQRTLDYSPLPLMHDEISRGPNLCSLALYSPSKGRAAVGLVVYRLHDATADRDHGVSLCDVCFEIGLGAAEEAALLSAVLTALRRLASLLGATRVGARLFNTADAVAAIHLFEAQSFFVISQHDFIRIVAPALCT